MTVMVCRQQGGRTGAHAMLTAVMRHPEAKAIDEALDLFQVLRPLG